MIGIISVMCFGDRRLFGAPDHGHDEESRNGREVKIDILEGSIRTPEGFRSVWGTYRVTGRGSGHPPGNYMGLMGQEGYRPAPRGLVRPM